MSRAFLAFCLTCAVAARAGGTSSPSPDAGSPPAPSSALSRADTDAGAEALTPDSRTTDAFADDGAARAPRDDAERRAASAPDGATAPSALGELDAESHSASIADGAAGSSARVGPDAGAGAPGLTTIVRAAPAERSASTVTVRREALEAAPHRSADELLLLVPGMFVAQHGGEGSAFQMFYRGFDAVHGQDVEINVAGAPVNDVSNLHGQGYADLHFLPPEVVQQVTATPGTYDPRQGDFAVAGSLRFDLGVSEPGLTAKVEGGSFNTWRAFLAYQPKELGPQTFIAAELYTTDGFGPSRAAKRASGIGQLQLPLGNDLNFRVTASTYFTRYANAGVLLRDDVERGAVDRFSTYDPTQGGSASRTQVVAEFRKDGAGATGALSAFFVYRTMQLRENFTGYLTGPEGDGQQQLNDAAVVGFNGHYRARVALFSKRDTIEAGASGRADFISQSQRHLSSVDNSVLGTSVDATVRGFNIAGWADLALHPFWFLTVRAGLRLDGLGYFAQDQGGGAAGQARASQGLHFGPKASLEVHPLAPLKFVVSYGEGFRSPQARSLQDGATTPFTTVRSVEGGVRLDFEKARGSLAGFYTYLSDDLVFDPATVRNTWVPATQRAGATAEGVVTPMSWVLISASVTYSRASFITGNTQYAADSLVPYAPQLVARLDAAVTPELGALLNHPVKLTVGLGGSVLAVRPLPYGQLGTNIALLDARVAVRWWHFEVGAQFWNLTNARWYEGNFLYASQWSASGPASLVPQQHVTVGAPFAARGVITLFL